MITVMFQITNLVETHTCNTLIFRIVSGNKSFENQTEIIDSLKFRKLECLLGYIK